MKKHTLRYLGQIISNPISDAPTVSWSEDAIDSIYQLAALAHPELMDSATDLP